MSHVKLGRLFFIISVAAFGLQHFMLEAYLNNRPTPDSFANLIFIFIGFVFRISLMILSLGILISNKPRRLANSLGLILLLWILMLHIPLLISNLNDPGEWNFASMALAICGGAFIVADTFSDDTSGYKGKLHVIKLSWINFGRFGRFFFGAAMIILGLQHLLYADFIASLIPTWIPGSYFWAYTTGIALMVSGLSIMLSIMIKWTSMLLGMMIFLWVVLLHFPRILSAPNDAYEWTTTFQALAITGSALALNRSLKKKELSTFLSTPRVKKIAIGHSISKPKSGMTKRTYALENEEHARSRKHDIRIQE